MTRARTFWAFTTWVLLTGCCCAQTSPATAGLWVATWGAAQQIPEPANALAPDDLRDATLRQVFHLSVGGTSLRVTLSNAFGTEPIHLTAVHLARTAGPAAIDVTTDRIVTFAGSPAVTIPAGAEMLSDPLAFPVTPRMDLAVTFHLDDPPARQTGHPGSRATSYLIHGDATAAPTLATLPGLKTVQHWYQVSEIDVLAPHSNQSSKQPSAQAIVVIGDSITDGHGATTDANDRWTDVLAEQFQSNKKTSHTGVVNKGIGGNHLLTDGLGPNALARFDRDVLAPAAVRSVVVFEGVNDLGGLARNGEVPPEEHAAVVARVEAAYAQMIARAHAHALRVFGATISPYVGSDYYHPGPLSEADRLAVNQWIRGHFDAVIDFDAVLRDPAHPDHLLPAYDCGDHLHPSPRGYRAMGLAAAQLLARD
jgi:lysophospholipase L1-like esterase